MSPDLSRVSRLALPRQGQSPRASACDRRRRRARDGARPARLPAPARRPPRMALRPCLDRGRRTQGFALPRVQRPTRQATRHDERARLRRRPSAAREGGHRRSPLVLGLRPPWLGRQPPHGRSRDPDRTGRRPRPTPSRVSPLQLAPRRLPDSVKAGLRLPDQLTCDLAEIRVEPGMGTSHVGAKELDLVASGDIIPSCRGGACSG